MIYINTNNKISTQSQKFREMNYTFLSTICF